MELPPHFKQRAELLRICRKLVKPARQCKVKSAECKVKNEGSRELRSLVFQTLCSLHSPLFTLHFALCTLLGERPEFAYQP